MNARDFALSALDGRPLPHWPKSVFHLPFEPPDDPRDRALAEQITIGVTKNLLHLEFLVKHFSGRELHRIDARVLKILAIGLYQLRFLTRIPARAAVDEAVEQAKRLGQNKAAGFVNAVLRKAAACVWPTLPDPTTHPREHAQDALSHPHDLYTRLEKLFGPQSALEYCQIHNAEPPTLLHLFPGQSAANLDPSIQFQPHELQGFVALESATKRTAADLADKGIGQIQDPTPAEAVAALNPQPGEHILDRCCGAGTKTLFLTHAVGQSGLVVALDRAASRCDLLRKSLQTRSISNVQVRQGSSVADNSTPYDAILVDVPCSNSGVLARRPEARYRQSHRHIDQLVHLQDEIMDDTAAHLAPGGRMVYSTCSIWPEENQQRIARFLEKHPDYRLVSDKTNHPALTTDATHWHDGGYWAALVRE